MKIDIPYFILRTLYIRKAHSKVSFVLETVNEEPADKVSSLSPIASRISNQNSKVEIPKSNDMKYLERTTENDGMRLTRTTRKGTHVYNTISLHTVIY